MLKISLMQFFEYLLGFLYKLAGFQSSTKEIQEKTPADFRGQNLNSVSADTTICNKQKS